MLSNLIPMGLFGFADPRAKNCWQVNALEAQEMLSAARQAEMLNRLDARTQYERERWLYEAMRPAGPEPKWVADQRTYRRRLASWQASLGPIKHGWG